MLLELTISYKKVMEQVHQRKLAKYEDVVEWVAKMWSALQWRWGRRG